MARRFLALTLLGLAAALLLGCVPAERSQPAIASPAPLPQASAAAGQPTRQPTPTSRLARPTVATAKASPTPAASPEAVVRSGRIALAPADILRAPEDRAEKLGQLPAQALVIVTAERGDWLEIVYAGGPGGHGWVKQSAVDLDSARAQATPSPTPALASRSTTATSVAPSQAPAVAIAPSPAPRLAGKLVFQERSGGNIYSMQADGSNLRRLTQGLEPALSPDGTQVAFTRWDEPRGLWIIGADGSNERLVFGANRVRSPTWTPDGQAIVFERNTRSVLCRSTPFGCLPEDELRALFGGQDCLTTPFGTFCIDDFPLFTVHFTALTRYDLATGAERDLPASETARAPRHHPADNSVLYLDDDGLAITRDAGDDPPQRLVQAPTLLGPAVYGSDGAFIYGIRRSHDHWDIWRWRADGSQPAALTAPPALRDRPISSVAPAVSPDGRSIAFLTDRRGQWELWVMDADGSNQRPLATEALSDVSFRYDFSSERMIDWGP